MFCPKCGADAGEGSSCSSCGASLTEIKAINDVVTPPNIQHIGVQQNIVNVIATNTVSPKSRTVALFLAIFLGILGAHRFYAGKSGTAVIWMFTGGCAGIGLLIDIIQIACGNFTDNTNTRISKWSGTEAPLDIFLKVLCAILGFVLIFIAIRLIIHFATNG